MLTFLLSSARFSFGLQPFYTAGYMSALAFGEVFFAPALAYVLARYLSVGGWKVVVQALFSVLGAGIPFMISLVKDKKIHSFYTVICAFLTELASMFLLPGTRMFLFLANAALSCLFSFLLLPLASQFKGRSLLFGVRETVLCFLVAFAFGAGSYGVRFFGISPYYLLLAFLLPVTCVLSFGGGAIPLAFALGASALSHEIAPVLAAAFASVLCEAVKGKRQIAAFALLVTEGLLYLLGGHRFSVLNFLLMFSGSLVAAFLPESFFRNCGVRLGRSESSATYAVINKARWEIGGKLGCLSDALRKMSDSLFELNGGENEEDAAIRLSKEFSKKLCVGCRGYRDCAAQGGGDPSPLFAPAILRALKNGKATICDLPPYLNANCGKAKAVLDGLGEAARIYTEEKAGIDLLQSERERMAEEATGIAGMLDVLRGEMKRSLSFDGAREKAILSELRKEGITAYDAMVTEGSDELGVTVTLEGESAENPRIVEAISRVAGVALIPEGVIALGAGAISASFRSAPLFDAIVGQAVRVKDGSDACGDTKSVTRLNGDRIMIALSDGMGSGERANKASSAAISLVENFYRTGVDEKTVLPLINDLLTMRGDGSFETLDMCVVDLRTAEADFIKLSAPESIIKRKEGSEIVEGGALPLGILREIRPSISRRRLASGDVVVLATDGVTDAIGAEGVMRVVESGRTNNPQTIADNVVRDASYVSGADDQTVVALRLFRRL